LTGKGGIFSGIVKEALETMLAEELDQHLTEERKNLGNDFNNRKLAIKNISKKWQMPVPNWNLIIGQLDIFFTGRLKLHLA
jgi:transposase-like protein